MSQLLAHHSVVSSMGDKAQSLLGLARSMPLSLWRNSVLLLACVWMVHSSAALFWLVFPLPSAPPPEKLAAPIATQVAVSGKSVNFDVVAGLKDVFGSVAPIAVAKPANTPAPVVDEAVTTRLRLKLHGVFASSDPTKGNAIIADGNEQKLYSVGEEIEKNRGVKLARVMQKRVILDNNGKHESLWLFSEDDLKSGPISNYAPSQQQFQRPPPVAPPPSRAQSPDVSLAPPGGSVETVRPDQIPKNIGDVVRFSVHREGGKMVGYRIRPGRDRELFNQVGLKANDIVTSVNGIEVNDPRQIRSVYKSMKTATEAQLTVLRDGETHSITIRLDTGA